MTNEEIDIRLKFMADLLPEHSKKLADFGYAKDVREFELMNMNLMTIWAMLGEIAKRLPEPK